MSDFGHHSGDIPPPFFTNLSRLSCMDEAQAALGSNISIGTASWGTANQIRYYPFTLPYPYLIRRMIFGSGSALTGQRSVAVYTNDFIQVPGTYSGPQTPTQTTGPNYWSLPTPVLLTPGEYYFGSNSSVAANNAWGTTLAASIQKIAGILQELGSGGALPDVATPAVPSVAGWCICGMTWTDSGF